MKQIRKLFCEILLIVGIACSISGCAARRTMTSTTSIPNASINRLKATDHTVAAGEEFLVVALADSRQYASSWHGGTLLAISEGKKQPLPVQKTAVQARVVAYISTVTVAQHFNNPYTSTIDGLYLFPLPANAALNDFIMTIGSRHIRGVIRARDEAEEIYSAAKRQGYTASLLNEDSPGLFSQSIANIEPGKVIETQITYFHALTLTNGWWQFVFPIAPNPANSVDFSLNLSIDAGLPITNQECKSHQVNISSASSDKLSVSLSHSNGVASGDFVFRYQVSGVSDATNFPTNPDDTDNAVRVLWAHSKMNELLSSITTTEQITQIRRLALKHNLLTPVSAFLSIDTSQTTLPKNIQP